MISSHGLRDGRRIPNRKLTYLSFLSANDQWEEDRNCGQAGCIGNRCEAERNGRQPGIPRIILQVQGYRRTSGHGEG